MKRTFLKALAVFLVFLTGTGCLVMVDTICHETTGEGGKLVLDIANLPVFQ